MLFNIQFTATIYLPVTNHTLKNISLLEGKILKKSRKPSMPTQISVQISNFLYAFSFENTSNFSRHWGFPLFFSSSREIFFRVRHSSCFTINTYYFLFQRLPLPLCYFSLKTQLLAQHKTTRFLNWSERIFFSWIWAS